MGYSVFDNIEHELVSVYQSTYIESLLKKIMTRHHTLSKVIIRDTDIAIFKVLFTEVRVETL